MRIVFILRKIYPYEIGGVELTYYYLLPYLKKHGISPILISEYRSKRFKTWKLKKIWPYSIFVKVQLLYLLFAKRKEYDIIHVPFMYTTSYLNWVVFPLINKLLKKEYVISIHGGRMSPWKPLWPYLIFFNNAKKISATAYEISKEYKKRIGREIYVIPSNIPLQKSKLDKSKILLKYNLKKSKNYFLIVGSLKKLKSPITVLKALLILKEKELLEKYDLHFIFAGDGPDKITMETFIKKNNIEQYVSLLGNLTREELPHLYKISFAYIIASELESFSISMFEAIFNKIPVINSNVKVFTSLLEDKKTSLFFNYKDEKGLADKIQLIIENDKLRESIVKNAFLKYESVFDYKENVVHKYLKLYK